MLPAGHSTLSYQLKTNIMRQLETQRLLLRPFTWDDFENLYQINSDPELMRYIRFPETREQTQESLKKILDDYQKFPDLGRLAIIEKSKLVTEST